MKSFFPFLVLAGVVIMEKFPIRPIINTLVIFVLMILAGAAPAFTDHAFEPWEDEVFVAIGKEYGPDAEHRIRTIMELIIANHEKPVMEKIRLTNDILNNIPWIADPDIWKREDYWATPLETLTTFGGDCEDIAIAKYAMLRLMGIPDDNLGFAYVETRDKERHMVLIFKENETSPVAAGNMGRSPSAETAESKIIQCKHVKNFLGESVPERSFPSVYTAPDWRSKLTTNQPD